MESYIVNHSFLPSDLLKMLFHIISSKTQKGKVKRRRGMPEG